MNDMKQKLYESLFFDIHSYTFNKEDECTELNGEHIAGCRIKKFYRVDSKYFSSYFSNLSNYVSSISDDIEFKNVPLKVLALKKVCALDRYRYTTHGKWLLHSEIMGTQLLDYFGCPCAYNVAIQNDGKSEHEYGVLSLNFIGAGDRFYTLSNMGCSLSRGLESSVLQMEKALEGKEFDDYDKKEKERLLEDYAYSYFVRRYVARDTDFFQGNSGVIVNKKKHSLKYVNFDLEYSFGECKPGIEEDLEYCYSRFPIVYVRFEQMVELYRRYFNEIRDEGITYQSYIQQHNILELGCALREVSDYLKDMRIDTALKTHY